MTKAEIAKILGVISALFPTFKVDDSNKKQTIDAWFWALEDYEYSAIDTALKIYVRTSGTAFAPGAPQLIALTRKPQELTEMNPQSAWALVSKAICRSTYYAAEEFEKLPPLVQTAVGCPDQLRAWASSDIDAIETVIASNFQKAYRAAAEQQRQLEFMPADIKNMIEQRTAAAIEEKKCEG